jgi:hypothetical protein
MPVNGHTDVEVIVNVDNDLVALVGLDHGSWEEVVHSVDLSRVAIRCSGYSTAVAVNKWSEVGWVRKDSSPDIPPVLSRSLALVSIQGETDFHDSQGHR